jgi:hypothetical protein
MHINCLAKRCGMSLHPAVNGIDAKLQSQVCHGEGAPVLIVLARFFRNNNYKMLF